MKISDKDIISAAQMLRDEENSQLHVRPWSRKRHFQFPAWLTAVPAAAVIGFLFGWWTNSKTAKGEPLTALADTVYVTVRETPTTTDTARAVTTPATQPQVHRAAVSGRKRHTHTVTTGQPMQSDRIRYDLLVRN